MSWTISARSAAVLAALSLLAICLSPAARAGTLAPGLDERIRSARPDQTLKVLVFLTEQAPIRELRAAQ